MVLSSTALRLSALVAAAMSAGYLWRAAVEPGGPAAGLSVAPPALRVAPAQVQFNSLDLLRPATTHAPASAGPPEGAAVVPTDGKTESHARPARFVSVTVRAPRARQAAPGQSRPATHPAKAKPTKSKRRSKPKPPAPPPRPNPPPPPAPAPPPAPPPPPPPQPTPPPPAGPPPPPVAGGETRPGRGWGDRNHRHTGPPGQQKPKRKKAERGESPEQAPGEQSPPEERGSGKKEKKPKR